MHHAVITSDLVFIEREKNNPALTLTRDSHGFTARELACLLGKQEIAELLGGYTPTITFSSYEALLRVLKECPLMYRYTVIGSEMRRKGRLFRDRLLQESAYSIQFVSEEIGYGLFAEKNLDPGEYIGEYAGLVGLFESGRNTKYMLHYPTRFFSMNTYVIDAQEHGNQMRFVNHSSNPNLAAELLLDRGLLHWGFFAGREICQGEEFTIDYGRDYWVYRNNMKNREFGKEDPQNFHFGASDHCREARRE